MPIPRQPYPFALGVNKSSSLAQGLVFLTLPGVRNGVDLVRNVLPTRTGYSSIASRYGTASKMATASGNNLGYGAYEPIPAASANMAYTFAAVAAPASSSSHFGLFFVQGDWLAGNYSHAMLAANCAKDEAVTAGKFALVQYSGGFQTQAESTAGMVDGDWHVFVGRKPLPDGTNPSVWRDGIDVTGSVVGPGYSAAASAGVSACGHSTQDGTADFPVALVAAWNRPLAPSEIVAFSRDPWQLLVPFPARKYFGVTAAGGNQSVSVPAAAVVVAAQTPTVARTARQTISVPAAAVTVAGQTPTIRQPHTVSVPAAPVVVAGQAPSIRQGVTVAVPAAAVVVAGQTPSVARTVNNYIRVPAASVLVNAFAPTVTVSGIVVTPTAPSGGIGRRRRRLVVEVDDELFEVATEQEGIELLRRAREVAEQAAQKAATVAVAKADRVSKPAAKARALAVPIPKMRVVEPDYSDPLTQQVQAQLEAAQVQIREIYQQALMRAKVVAAHEQKEVAEAIAADDEADREMVGEFLKVVEKTLGKRSRASKTRRAGEADS